MNSKQKKLAKKIQKKETKKTDVFKCKKNDSIVIGIDVHKKTYHVAVRKNTKQVVDWSMEHDDQKLINIIIKAKKNIKKIVYEAGPTGYALARLLQKHDLNVGVVAPGKTPRAANEGNKSDRIDSKKLALFAEQKNLKYVQPPTEEEDAIRKVTRRREDLTDKSAKVKIQIKGFLLYYNITDPYKGAWTLEYINSLRELELSDKLRNCLIEAGWVWVKVDPAAKALYSRLLRNTGSSKKAITAVAHQIAINLWSMLTHKQRYKDLL